MTEGLADRDTRKRLGAAIAIQERGEGSLHEAAETLASLLAYVESISMEAMERLIVMGDESAEPLVRMARSGPDGFTYPATPLFDSEDEARGRSLALTALWRRAQAKGVPDPGALESFLDGLTHRYAGVRTQALHGLKELEDRTSADALKVALNDESTYIREEAAALMDRLRNA